jgi:hypothetical protein
MNCVWMFHLNDYQQQGFYQYAVFYAFGYNWFVRRKYNQFYYNSLQTNFTLQKTQPKIISKNSLGSRLLG